jgi:PA domain
MKVLLSTALLVSAWASSSVVPLPKLAKEDVRRLHQEQVSRNSMLTDGGGIGVTARSASARKLAISDNSILTVAAADGSMNPITLTHSDALFGLPLHGATLTASLNSMLINSGTDAAKGCNPGDYSSILRGQIILVERGNCSFAQKVLNAQNYGDARAVIVVDTYYLCGIDTEICDGQAGCGGCEEGFQPSSPLCMCTLNFMSADQNQLNQLDIPAMMITKRDGARLKTLAETGVALIGSMSWDLPERNGAAEL